MSSVNKVILIGNCGRDPEVRYMQSGQAVANISVATTSRRKDKTTGEMIEDTQWHRVTLYERLAEIAEQYLKKGSSVYIEGRIKYGKYTDQAGVERNTCDITATEMQMLGGRGDSQQQTPGQTAAPAAAQQQARYAPQAQQAQRPAPPASQQQDPLQDDDLPF